MTVEEMKELKKKKGYSVANLSKLSGVPVGTIQKIFSGETVTPRYETRISLEKALLCADDEYILGCSNPSMVRESSAVYQVSPMKKQQGEYTIEDYYALPDDKRVELIDGVIYDMGAPSFVHQQIAGVIYAQILAYIAGKKGKCIPLIAPVDVRLDCDDRTMVQPDVGILCDLDKIRQWGIMGAPDFILEVISPSTKGKDMLIKLTKYQKAGVKEYWIIDPKQKKLFVYAFETETWPAIHDLTGEVGLAIYDYDLKIDLDKIASLIQEWPK